MSEERQIIPHSDNLYCPSCGAIYRRGEKFCSQCGAALEEQNKKSKEEVKKETESSEELTTQKKNKKNKIIALVIILILLFFIGGGVAVYYYYYSKSLKNNKDFENKINSIWSEFIDKNNKFKDDLQTPATENDLSELNDDSFDLEKLAKNKISEIDKLETPQNYNDSKNKLKIFLEKYIKYQSKLRFNILNKNIANINVDKNFNESQKYADYASDALNDFMKVSSYIKDTLSDDVFNLTELKKFIEKVKGEEASEAAKKSEEEQEAAQAAAKQAAEKTVNNFMINLPNAYSVPPTQQWARARQITDQYWYTPAMNNFNNDYKNYFDETPGSPIYLGGQVIKSEKISDTKYDVTAEENEKYTTTHGDMEDKHLSYFIVEKIGTAGWFIISHGRK